MEQTIFSQLDSAVLAAFACLGTSALFSLAGLLRALAPRGKQS